MGKIILNTLLYLWQLPLNICGILYLIISSTRIDASIMLKDCCIYVIRGLKGAVTLGLYIFIGDTMSDKMSTIVHESGHVLQSRRLGPLYILVIGIPSIIHAAIHKSSCSAKSYYHFYTERWANRLSKWDKR